jgi:hypothetical protein
MLPSMMPAVMLASRSPLARKKSFPPGLRSGNFVCFAPLGAVTGWLLLMNCDRSTFGLGEAAIAG